MKKIFATAALLAMVTGQVFAQDTAPSAPARMAARPLVGSVNLAGTIAIGIAVAAIAAAASDNSSTTTHH